MAVHSLITSCSALPAINSAIFPDKKSCVSQDNLLSVTNCCEKRYNKKTLWRSINHKVFLFLENLVGLCKKINIKIKNFLCCYNPAHSQYPESQNDNLKMQTATIEIRQDHIEIQKCDAELQKCDAETHNDITKKKNGMTDTPPDNTDKRNANMQAQEMITLNTLAKRPGYTVMLQYLDAVLAETDYMDNRKEKPQPDVDIHLAEAVSEVTQQIDLLDHAEKCHFYEYIKSESGQRLKVATYYITDIVWKQQITTPNTNYIFLYPLLFEKLEEKLDEVASQYYSEKDETRRTVVNSNALSKDNAEDSLKDEVSTFINHKVQKVILSRKDWIKEGYTDERSNYEEKNGVPSTYL